MNKFRVWCLSWEEDESDGHDVVHRSFIDGPPTVQERRTIYSTFADDAGSAAEAYAEHVHDQRDGWECTWPLTFRVRKPDGTTEDFEVEREYEPTFSASAVKPKDAG